MKVVDSIVLISFTDRTMMVGSAIPIQCGFGSQHSCKRLMIQASIKELSLVYCLNFLQCGNSHGVEWNHAYIYWTHACMQKLHVMQYEYGKMAITVIIPLINKLFNLRVPELDKN